MIILFCIFTKKWLFLLTAAVPFLREDFFKHLPKKQRISFGKYFWIPELLAVFGFSLYCIYRGMNDPFLYFRF